MLGPSIESFVWHSTPQNSCLLANWKIFLAQHYPFSLAKQIFRSNRKMMSYAISLSGWVLLLSANSCKPRVLIYLCVENSPPSTPRLRPNRLMLSSKCWSSPSWIEENLLLSVGQSSGVRGWENLRQKAVWLWILVLLGETVDETEVVPRSRSLPLIPLLSFFQSNLSVTSCIINPSQLDPSRTSLSNHYSQPTATAVP